MYVLPAVLLRGRGYKFTPPPPNCATQTSWGFVVLHEIRWTLRNQKWYLCAGAGAVKQQLPCPSAVCQWETGEAISGQTRLLCFPCLLDCYCHCYCYMSDDTAFGCRYQCAWLVCSRIDPLVEVTDPWETPPPPVHTRVCRVVEVERPALPPSTTAVRELPLGSFPRDNVGSGGGTAWWIES